MGLLLETNLMEVITAVIVLGYLCYWYLTNTYDYWEKRNVPFKKPLLLFGSVKDRLTFRLSSCEVFQNIYNDFEGHKIAGIWLMKRPTLFVRDPEIIKRILVKDFAHFHDRGMPVDEKRNPLSAHLFNLEGMRWKKLRHKLSPTFTSGKMKMMYSLMNECSKEFTNYLESYACTGEPIEMKEILARFSTDVIGNCAFGVQCNSIKYPDSKFREMGRRVFKPSKLTVLRQIVSTVFPLIGKLFNLRFPEEEVSDFFINMVQETVEYREKNNIKRNDFLDLLIQLKNKGVLEDEEAEKKAVLTTGTPNEKHESGDIEITDTLLASQAFVFFLAGFETSSTTMSFAIYELAMNPDIQVRLQEEIDSVLKQHDGQFSYDAIMKMEYLDKVVCESLRKYPPVPVLFRVCNKEYVIPETGTVVEEGLRVHIPIHAMHNDTKYFTNPKSFDPEHFSEENKAKLPHYVYMPFGEGPRICIGMRFGLLQTKLGIASLFAKYDISCCEKTPSPMVLDRRSFVTSCEGGVWVRVSPRKS